MRTASTIGTALVTLLANACAQVSTVSPAPDAQPQCAAITFPLNERIGTWSVDKFNGRYVAEGNTLVIRRDQHRLLVEGWVLGRRELTAESVESWTWRDGCGVSYAFMLPPDGPGARLKVTMPGGATTDWHR